MFWLNLIKSIFEFLGLVGREVHDAEQRHAGAAESQLEATNAEITRTQDAANAGAAVDNQKVMRSDIYDRDK